MVGASLPTDSARVAYWPGEGDATDVVGSFNGVLVSNPTFVPGFNGSAFHFNGSGAVVRIPNGGASGLGLPAFTYSAWVRPSGIPTDPLTQIQGQGIITGLAPDSIIAVEPNGSGGLRLIGSMRTDFFGSAKATGADIPPGSYSHVAVTYDGTTLKLYVNGVFNGERTATKYFANSPPDHVIGGYPPGTPFFGAGQYFKGDIDEVVVFNRALTDSEVQTVFGYSPDPVGPQQKIFFDVIDDRPANASPFAPVARATSELPVNFAIISGPAAIVGGQVSVNGAGSVVVEASQAGNGTFQAAAPVQRSFTAQVVAQTISFAAIPDKPPGTLPFALGATASSGLPVAYVVDSGPATVSGDTLTLTGAGTITVRATQPGNSIYSAAADVTRTFKVLLLPQTITFGNILDKPPGTPPFNLIAVASSGLPVAFSVDSGPATISGNTITLTGSGTVTVRARQAGDASYEPAPDVTRTFLVGLLPQTISFGTIADQPVDKAPFALSATASSGLPVSFSIDSGPATISGNTITLTGTGAVSVRATQVGNATYDAAPAVVRVFNVFKRSQTIAFADLPDAGTGDATFHLKATASSGLPVSFSLVSGPATLAGDLVTLTGAGAVVVTASQAGNATYLAAADVTRSFTVHADPASGLIAYWPAEDSTTDVVGGNNGVGVGQAFGYGAGVVGHAFRFNYFPAGGDAILEDAYVQVPHAKALVRRTFTVSGWVQELQLSSINILGLLEQDFGIGVRFGTGDGNYSIRARAFINGILLFTRDIALADPVAHVAASWNGETLKLYVNGAYETEVTPPGFTRSFTGGDFTMGSGSTAGGIRGNVDEVKIFGRVLSDAEIAALYYSPGALAAPHQVINPHEIGDRLADSEPFELNFTSSSGLPVTYSVVSGPAVLAGNFVLLTGTGKVTIEVNQAGNTTYLPASPLRKSFNVLASGKIDQFITFDNIPNKVLGSPPFSVTATASSGLPVTFSIVSGPATISGNTVTLTGVGTVGVYAAQAGNGSYNPAGAVRYFQVSSSSKLSQTISFDTIPDKVSSSAPFAVTASASSGLPVSFSIVSGPATVSGNTITLTGGTGTVVVRAAQGGDASYDPAVSVDRTFNVSAPAKLNQTISFAGLSDRLLAESPFSLSATASSGLPVSFTILSGLATVSGNSVTLTGAGLVTVRALQGGDASYNPAPFVDRTFTVRGNGAPTITPIPDQSLAGGQTLQVHLAITDAETPNGPFVVTATSLTPDLIAPENLILGGDGGTRLLFLSARDGKSGTGRIRVTAADNLGAFSTAEFNVAVRRPATFKPLSDLMVDMNTVIGPLPVELADRGDLGGSLNWSASSSNQELLPDDHILISSQTLSCSLVLVPVTGRTGAVTVTVRVGDGVLVAQTQFQVIVRQPNQAPQISPVADQTVTAGQSVVVAFKISDAETPAGKLTVKSASSRSDLIPQGNVVLGGVDGDRTATLTALSGKEGLGSITLTATDEGGLSSSVSFGVLVSLPPNQTPTISLNSPVEGSEVDERQVVVLAATATDPEGQVARVEFYDGTTLLGVDSEAPYRLETTNLAVGAHVITARVVDGAGNSAVTPGVSVTVRRTSPANDAFAARAPIDAFPVLASTLLATREGREPAHAGSGLGPSIWYRWSSPLDAQIRLSTAGSTFDTVLAVYTGETISGLTEVASNDDDPAGGLTSLLSFQAKAGVNYAIAVAGAGQSGEVRLDLSVVEVTSKPLVVRQSAQGLVLSWPVDLPGAVVETTAGLSADGTWLPLPPPSTTVDGNYVLKIVVQDNIRFYRMRVSR